MGRIGWTSVGRFLFGLSLIQICDLLCTVEKEVSSLNSEDATKVQIQFSDEDFRKSSLSRHSKRICVQVAIKSEGVGVRDSKDPSKTTLQFTPEEWNAFIGGVKVGEFDL